MNVARATAVAHRRRADVVLRREMLGFGVGEEHRMSHTAEEERAYVARIHNTIEKHGQHVVTVDHDDPSVRPDEMPFSYTIGNHERGLPELMIMGSPELAAVLDLLGQMMRE